MSDNIDRPIPDSYWVKNSRLLAGEYPGAKDKAEARSKIGRLLDAGIDAFLDLTEEDEHGLWPYSQILGQLSPDRHIRWIRFPILDASTTDNSKLNGILDTIDNWLAQGRNIYVHCWGGHGRTGTVVGCHLVRHGQNGKDALEAVKRLHGGMSDGWKPSPETDAQRKFVIGWARHDCVLSRRATHTEQADRVRGCLLGGAVGDALGAPVEFMKWSQIKAEFGPDGIQEYAPAYGKIGAITDDTQMTLFTLEGLIRARRQHSPKGEDRTIPTVHLAYLRWLKTQNEHSAHPAFDEIVENGLIKISDLHSLRAPGNTCLSALRGVRIGTTKDPLNDSKGCGGIMRAAPAGLVDARDSFKLGCDVAAITHGHPSGYLSAGYLAEVVHQITQGKSLPEAINSATKELKKWPSYEECLAAVEKALALAENGPVSPEQIESLGGAWVGEEALAISLYCALVAEDFDHGTRLAVNHGGDSDSTGAITGNILGALWGERTISNPWLENLELRPEIVALAQALLDGVLEGD